MKCPNCNREIDNDSVFCEYCGYQTQSNFSRLNWILCISFIVCSIVLLCCMSEFEWLVVIGSTVTCVAIATIIILLKKRRLVYRLAILLSVFLALNIGFCVFYQIYYPKFVEAKVDLYKLGRFEQTYTLGVFSFDEINADLWDRELAGGRMFRYIEQSKAYQRLAEDGYELRYIVFNRLYKREQVIFGYIIAIEALLLIILNFIKRKHTKIS